MIELFYLMALTDKHVNQNYVTIVQYRYNYTLNYQFTCIKSYYFSYNSNIMQLMADLTLALMKLNILRFLSINYPIHFFNKKVV